MNPSLTEKPQVPRDNLGFRPKQPLAESLLVLIVTHSTRRPLFVNAAGVLGTGYERISVNCTK